MDDFLKNAALICEPVRANILWQLLDGRAYTAGELAMFADVSATSASNHLSRLLEGKLVKVESQGRHRYYSLATPEVAYVIESLASLSGPGSPANDHRSMEQKPVKFCRTCYDHLAGYVGVRITQALELAGYIKRSGTLYVVSDEGWKWFKQLGITKDLFTGSRRPLARQCLDWSERRPHLAGSLGAAMLQMMFDKKWFKAVQYGRELSITLKGRGALIDLLGLEIGQA